MKKLRHLAILLLCSFCICQALNAQTKEQSESKPVVVHLKNGDSFHGHIVSKDEVYLILQTENGEMRLIADNVIKIEEDTYQGKFGFDNPHRTRYFFGPSAYPLQKGNGYYQNVLLTSNFVNYGITNNISIGGGFEFLSTVLGNPILFLNPKVGFNVSEKVSLGGGFILTGIVGEGSATLAYGVATVGRSESNVSLGSGFGFVDGEFSSRPILMVSGSHRVSRVIALMTENYMIPGSEDLSYFGIHGIRLLSKKNAFDIGVIVIPEIFDEVPALPFIGFARMF